MILIMIYRQIVTFLKLIFYYPIFLNGKTYLKNIVLNFIISVFLCKWKQLWKNINHKIACSVISGRLLRDREYEIFYYVA